MTAPSTPSAATAARTKVALPSWMYEVADRPWSGDELLPDPAQERLDDREAAVEAANREPDGAGL